MTDANHSLWLDLVIFLALCIFYFHINKMLFISNDSSSMMVTFYIVAYFKFDFYFSHQRTLSPLCIYLEPENISTYQTVGVIRANDVTYILICNWYKYFSIAITWGDDVLIIRPIRTKPRLFIVHKNVINFVFGEMSLFNLANNKEF